MTVQENTGAAADLPGDADVTDDFGLAGVPDWADLRGDGLGQQLRWV